MLKTIFSLFNRKPPEVIEAFRLLDELSILLKNSNTISLNSYERITPLDVSAEIAFERIVNLLKNALTRDHVEFIKNIK